MPIGFGMMGITVFLPALDFGDKHRLIGNTAVEALAGQHGEFGFGHIEPAAMLGRIMPLEALDQPPGFGGREGFIE